ncbi:MAG TPA: CHASE2 domain-containing protein [Bryobacteraceae bacterium]|nr:CHASE2 domain-containing protein [Bryobacteraceae bacterium]
MKRPGFITWGYAGALAACVLAAVIVGWLAIATAIDGDIYDWLFRLQPSERARTQSVVLAIDEATLSRYGGVPQTRAIIADTLERIADAGPSVVAVDVILRDKTAEDARLAAALARTPNVVLAADILPGTSTWEDPLPAFRAHAAAVGHVHAEPDPVSRVLPLEKAAGGQRRWALALEAYRLHKRAAFIEESPDSIDVGGTRVPAARADARAMYIRYAPLSLISVANLRDEPGQLDQLRGRAVFIGDTALSAARDRLMTPLGPPMMAGVEIHANAFETLAAQAFIRRAPLSWSVTVSVLLVVAAGLVFAFLSGWPAYLAGSAIVAVSHTIPHVAFSRGVLFDYVMLAAAAWLSVGTAAAWQYFVVRRQLRKTESDKARYQQAIHFVTHEMRSPLTAIQGSSELMGRYNLNDEKRRQIAEMINSESKRLARMIQTFLDIERLTEGQMDLRSDRFDVVALAETCVQRARPLAERKQIDLRSNDMEPLAITGDRELMEYALYNLLTNAIKYSPAHTTVTIDARREASLVHISVRDQGIGMDAQELRNIGRKFYRTRKAEASGEAGTGIGLSLVQQIVEHHGGRMQVSSTPGQGSCFTMVLPCGIPATPASASTVLSN